MVYLFEKLFCTYELVSLSFENNNDIGVEGVKILVAGLNKVLRLESLLFYDVNRNIDRIKEIFKVIYICFGKVFVYCLRLIRLDLFVNLLY